MSLLRKLKDAKHLTAFVKRHDNYLTNGDDYAVDLNQRNLVVYHIDSETEGTFCLTVKNDDLGETVLNRVCDHYNLHDYKEYFGLKFTLVDDHGDHEILWLDPLKLVGKQLKDTNNVLTFRVKHFPGKPQLIESEYVRYLIFLQIRNYLLKGDLQLSTTEETRLAAYAVQAELGDFDANKHVGNYLTTVKFLSRKSLKSEESIMEMHKQLKGKSPAEMELAFLETASKFDTYGAELIVVKTSKGVPINFGVSHNGIITYLHGTPANTAQIDMFPWTQIGKISYEGRTLKVHFHTADQGNPEVYKKQVMVFKCNNSRICKHLWKFILDQKAFFNFKRGVDVPKIRSSSRLFSHKSKFRFSGRCENELISAQQNSSVTNVSTLSDDVSKTIKSYQSSYSIESGTPHSNTFKRRTFISTPRSTFVRSKHPDPTQALNDSNNNAINSSAPKASFETNQRLNPLPETGSQSTLAASDAAYSPSAKMSTSPLSNDLNNIQNMPAQATSTPQTNVKNTADSSKLSNGSMSSSINNSNESIETTRNVLNRAINQKVESDSDSDKFYDHDDYESCLTNRKPVLISETEPSFELRPLNVNLIPSSQKAKSNFACNFAIVVLMLFVFFLFYMLIQYWKCSLGSETNLIIRNDNCNLPKKFSKLKDFLNYSVQLLKSALFAANKNEWMPWPKSTTQNCLTDPIFNSFFSQHNHEN